MARSLAEQTLSRVCDYLADMGVELTREVTMHAFKLVEEGLDSDHEDPLHYVMSRVNHHFVIQEPQLPTTAPPITRSSMGFDK